MTDRRAIDAPTTMCVTSRGGAAMRAAARAAAAELVWARVEATRAAVSTAAARAERAAVRAAVRMSAEMMVARSAAICAVVGPERMTAAARTAAAATAAASGLAQEAARMKPTVAWKVEDERHSKAVKRPQGWRKRLRPERAGATAAV